MLSSESPHNVSPYTILVALAQKSRLSSNDYATWKNALSLTPSYVTTTETVMLHLGFNLESNPSIACWLSSKLAGKDGSHRVGTHTVS